MYTVKKGSFCLNTGVYLFLILYISKSERSDVKKSGSFGWCLPQNGLPPPLLWSNYHFFCGKIFICLESADMEK